MVLFCNRLFPCKPLKISWVQVKFIIVYLGKTLSTSSYISCSAISKNIFMTMLSSIKSPDIKHWGLYLHISSCLIGKRKYLGTIFNCLVEDNNSLSKIGNVNFFFPFFYYNKHLFSESLMK